MSRDVLEYCARAVVQHLGGDFKQFKKYRDIAMAIYESEEFTIGNRISVDTKIKLRKLVS